MARETGAMITFLDAQYMVEHEGFTALDTIPNSNELMTRSAIEYYLDVNSNHLSDYSSNELVPYHIIFPETITDYSVDVDYNLVDTSGSGKTMPNAINIYVATGVRWTVEIESGDSWIDVNPMHARGNGTIDITVHQNPSYTSVREGSIRIDTGNDHEDIIVRQQASVDYNAPNIGTLSITGKTVDTVSLEWSAASDNLGVTQYRLHNTTTNQTHTFNSSTLSYTETGLDSDTTYQYYLTARDSAGNWSSNSNTVTVTTNEALSNVNLSSGYSTMEAAYINGTSGSQYYFNGSDFHPDNLDRIFTDLSGAQSFNGNNEWYRIISTNYVLRIDTSGYVMDKYNMTNTLSVSPTYKNLPSSSGSFTFSVTSNTTWYVSDNVGWLSTSGADGSGNDSSVTATYNENTAGTSRNGTITVRTDDNSMSATIYIYQEAAVNTFAHSIGYSGSNSGACDQWNNNNRSTYYTDTAQFTSATKLYTDAAGTNLAPSGYYSNGMSWRHWTGTMFGLYGGTCFDVGGL